MSSIWAAAQRGTLSKGTLRDFLDKGPEVINGEDTSGITPLGYAIQNGQSKVVKLLLENGADVDKEMGERSGFPSATPLYLAAIAKPVKPRMFQLLLSKKPMSLNKQIPGKYENKTPLMAAISETGDPRTISLLMDAGASLDIKDDNQNTVKDLVDKLKDPAQKNKIKDALEPKLKKGGGGFRAYISKWTLGVLGGFKAWKTLGSIFKSATKYFYGVASPVDTYLEYEDEVEEPKTAADFKNNLDDVVNSEGLDQFFPPGDNYIKEVADKAAALRDDPNNLLNTPSQLKDLGTIALYQPVLYCDDSLSMGWGNEDRWNKQAELAKRIANVANQAVPGQKGVHLRFINTDTPDANSLSSDAIAQKIMGLGPNGSTPIGTNLRKRILVPFIYSVIEAGQLLERPYLIFIITDGCPWGEDEDELRNAILECSRFLEENGHRKDAVRFCINQIGTNEDAKEFMDTLNAADNELSKVLHRNSELLDKKYDELMDSEAELQDWLLTMLLSPVRFLSAS